MGKCPHCGCTITHINYTGAATTYGVVTIERLPNGKAALDYELEEYGDEDEVIEFSCPCCSHSFSDSWEVLRALDNKNDFRRDMEL